MPDVNSSVRFLLGNKPVEIVLNGQSGYLPSTTVLNYLRSLHDHKGVKEGCAEGDCGACTVVAAIPTSDKTLKYVAVNSCLVFLPWLHGKQLITVENLSEGKNLHPVQQWMVEHYGSQCGFCTPGIVMSLFALYKGNLPADRSTAISSMSGNLCRCTGYQPILDVAMKSLQADGEDQFTAKEADVAGYLTSLQSQSLLLKSSLQSYHKPGNLNEALAQRKNHPSALLSTGATDLALRQSKKFELLPEILDLSGLQELNCCTEEENCWKIGAGTPINDVWSRLGKSIPVLNEVFSVFASHQIRNLATIAGNIGSASPIGDLIPVFISLEAGIILKSSSGEREMPVEDFITGYRTTELKPDEIIHSFRIPKSVVQHTIRFFKVSKRRELDISTVSMAARLEFNSNGSIDRAILAFGGMAAKTSRANSAETYLTGKQWNPETSEEAARLVAEEFNPISDARSGKEARKIMAGNLLRKLFVETTSNIRQDA